MPNNHLIIGLGGTGGKMIREFRKLVYQRYGNNDPAEVNLRYLYVDSSETLMQDNDPEWKVLTHSVQLQQSSQVRIKGHNLKEVIRNKGAHGNIAKWIGEERLWDSLSDGVIFDGGQKRRLGRFLLANSIDKFLSQLHIQIAELNAKGQKDVTFHICAGLAGGTGSGCLIDAIAQIRKSFWEISKTEENRIVVYALLPDLHPNPAWARGNYHANGYAALKELNALNISKYRPYDISSGQGNLVSLKSDPFNGCYLITDHNENGRALGVERQIPQLTASFIFQKIASEKDFVWDDLARKENAENYTVSKFENGQISDKNERTLRFLSFGIKKIAVPEQEIKEYFTFNFAKQALLQLKFNTWSDTFGFSDQPNQRNFNGYVREPETMKDWKLTDEHLMRCEPVLVQDDQERLAGTFKEIKDEWQFLLPKYKDTVKESPDKKSWLDRLGALCKRRFEDEYRNQGVARYFSNQEQAIDDIAKQIRQDIEKLLFGKWGNGEVSMEDVGRIVDSLIKYSEERLGTFTQNIVKIQKEEEAALKKIQTNQKNWSDIGIFGEMTGKHTAFLNDQATCLETYFVAQTQREAYKFAGKLLSRLINRDFAALRTEVNKCTVTIDTAYSEFKKKIDLLLNDGGTESLNADVIKFYKPEEVKSMVKGIVLNKEEQSEHSKGFRAALALRIGDSPDFSRFNERLGYGTLLDCLTELSESNAINVHNRLVAAKDKVLGVGIIDKLRDVYESKPAELQGYLREIVAAAGCYAGFNAIEKNKTGQGTAKEFAESIAFIVPKPGFDIQQGFSASPSDSPEIKFQKTVFACLKGSTALKSDFICTETDKNAREISIVSLKNLFPARFVGDVADLKEKYLQRMQEGGERAIMEIHSEGDGKSFPDLFLLTDGGIKDFEEEMRKSYLPYLLLAKATNAIQNLEDPQTGRKKLALLRKDTMGFELDPLYFDDDLIKSFDGLNEESGEILKTTVEASLKTDFLHIDKRKELIPLIVKEVEAVKAAKGGNSADPVFVVFNAAGRDCVRILDIS